MNGKEERYVDILTDMALSLEEDEEIDTLIQIAENELPPESVEPKELIWQQFEKKQKHSECNERKSLHILRIIADVAACFILLLTISFTVAMANNEWVRSNVYRLLFNSDTAGTTVQMAVDEELTFYVPSAWNGDYYPANIPDDFYTVSSMSNTGTSLELWDRNQRMLVLEENPPQAIAWIDTEGAEVSSTIINGHPSYIFEKTYPSQRYSCTIVIDLEDRYYIISGINISRAELLTIAESVRHIIINKTNE